MQIRNSFETWGGEALQRSLVPTLSGGDARGRGYLRASRRTEVVTAVCSEAARIHDETFSQVDGAGTDCFTFTVPSLHYLHAQLDCTALCLSTVHVRVQQVIPPPSQHVSLVSNLTTLPEPTDLESSIQPVTSTVSPPNRRSVSSLSKYAFSAVANAD